MQQWNWIAAGALVLLLCMIPINAQDKQELRPVAMVPYEGGPPDFEKDVLPILENKCTTCHSGSNKKGRLDLSSYEALLRGGKHGAAVVAGKPESSLLIQLSGKTQKPAMPPDDDEPLTPQELALLKAWVAQGAAGSSGSSPKTTTIKLTRIAERVQPVLALALTPGSGPWSEYLSASHRCDRDRYQTGR
ncbi:MAG TPA: hypothetical protein PKD72_03695 [Gemmatales bacterium]|nr:hypothetical protein [Gemmatales bacterium]